MEAQKCRGMLSPFVQVVSLYSLDRSEWLVLPVKDILAQLGWLKFSSKELDGIFKIKSASVWADFWTEKIQVSIFFDDETAMED